MKALIIDDNASLRTLLEVFMQSLGFQTDLAENGGLAFGLIKKNDYDVIVSDIDMPVINGVELFDLIVKHAPHLISRIVFTTGNSLEGVYRDFFMQVPCPVVLKPFSLHELADTIGSIVPASRSTQAARQPHQVCA